MKRLAQGDAKTALEQHGKIPLSPDELEQFKILCVARADL